MENLIILALTIGSYTLIVMEYYKKKYERELEKVKREQVVTYDSCRLRHVVVNTSIDRECFIDGLSESLMRNIAKELSLQLKEDIKENIIVEEDCYNNKHKVYVDVWFKN